MFDQQSGSGRDESLFAEGYSRNSPRWGARCGRLAATRPTDGPRPGGRHELLGSGGSRPHDGDGGERDVRPQRTHGHLAGRDSPRERGGRPGGRVRRGRLDEPPSAREPVTGSTPHVARRGPDGADDSCAPLPELFVWRPGRPGLPPPSRVVVFRGISIHSGRNSIPDRRGDSTPPGAAPPPAPITQAAGARQPNRPLWLLSV